MKNLLLLLTLFLTSLGNAFAGIIVVEGKYQDKNLYVQNGYAGNGVGFCTYEVTINGKTSTDEVNSSAFEIDFVAFAIKPGTPVIVEIRHKDDCSPKVLNPEALKPRATFEVINIEIDKNAILNWSTKNEMGSLPYIVEQFRWNKWIPVGEVKGNGAMDKNTYSFQTTSHSGENKFRVKQIGYGDLAKTSSNVTYISATGQPTYTMNKTGTEIDFSAETMYEVFDEYGNVIKRGYGNRLDISNLSKGSYYLCYDNIMTDFVKKK
ncbi:MAG: hypothetical protein IPP64_04220 [Bacteroidetes bacterium]|nr:hypothetical protein [Bacteroidota bacterium]